MGISEATFFNWKKKFGGLGVSELRRLRQLKEENSKLKQFVADQTCDGRRFRALTVVDNFSRKCLAIHSRQSIRGDCCYNNG
jgi:hypothetical protein